MEDSEVESNQRHVGIKCYKEEVEEEWLPALLFTHKSCINKIMLPSCKTPEIMEMIFQSKGSVIKNYYISPMPD